ncbi:MAG: N(4)-acetylcytidine aminohydrolase [Spirochaetales bacterium]|uniref:N(4)-acetylcytidine aminohydrolase n=1 Tax=Candidatus Thalassospirochaeta sargassi TaxID=3119039 RepID=A0AAJ1IIL5_9SPIO|nr:N(4)-acetylcytidine aminohydrolase [Spirochaetales bacterium]
MEILDIYDEQRKKTDKQIVRGTSLLQGEYFLVIHVCILSPDNLMLIQQRTDFKPGWPGKWDFSVGGIASAGENSYEAARRETLEELGLSTELIMQRPQFTINFSRGFDDYFIIKDDIDITELRLQEEEVQDVKWASKAEIEAMIEQGDFIPYRKGLLDLIFDMQDGRGAQYIKPPEKITFFERLIPFIESGKKTITIRDESESHYVPGSRVAVHVLESDLLVCYIDIVSIEQISFDDINESHAEQEHMDLPELKKLIREIYPEKDKFYVIKYTLCK